MLGGPCERRPRGSRYTPSCFMLLKPWYYTRFQCYAHNPHLSTWHLSTCIVTWCTSKCWHNGVLNGRNRLLVIKGGLICHQTKLHANRLIIPLIWKHAMFTIFFSRMRSMITIYLSLLPLKIRKIACGFTDKRSFSHLNSTSKDINEDVAYKRNTESGCKLLYTCFLVASSLYCIVPYRYSDNQRAQDAINLTLFHWGVHGWIVYVDRKSVV